MTFLKRIVKPVLIILAVLLVVGCIGFTIYTLANNKVTALQQTAAQAGYNQALSDSAIYLQAKTANGGAVPIQITNKDKTITTITLIQKTQ